MKEKIFQLNQEFPEVVRINKPATKDQLQRTEQLLGFTLGSVDEGWLEFLRTTNGASVLAYCFNGAMTTRIVSIAEVNQQIWSLDHYSWIRQHFICFFGDASPMNIGFVRENQRTKCIGFISELTDNAVLPIASSFEIFLGSFLQDVEDVLRSWKPRPGEKWPYTIPGVWPLDLRSWCKRDHSLKKMFVRGELEDLYKHNEEYAEIVEDALRL